MCFFVDFTEICPPQFSYVPGTSNCYLASEKQAYTRQQADTQCKSRRGVLLALETKEEYDATKSWFMGSEYLFCVYR